MKIPHIRFGFTSLLFVFLTAVNAPCTSANTTDTPTGGFTINARPIFHHPNEQAPPHILYSIPLKDGADQLTSNCCIAKDSTGFDERKQRFQHTFRYGNPQTILTTSAFDFFQPLVSPGKYTYILKKNKLTFIKAYSVGNCNACTENCITRRQKASKHLFLTNFAEHVQMAGEFRVYQPNSDLLFVVFDNGSGNYAPDPLRVSAFLDIIHRNLNPDPRITFLGKTYTQQFNPETLQIEDLPQ